MMFELTHNQLEKVREWEAEQDKIMIERQRGTMSPEDFADLTDDGRIPYYGAIGGSMTYSFTPTSIGDVVVVTHGGTRAELNITDYSEW